MERLLFSIFVPLLIVVVCLVVAWFGRNLVKKISDLSQLTNTHVDNVKSEILQETKRGIDALRKAIVVESLQNARQENEVYIKKIAEILMEKVQIENSKLETLIKSTVVEISSKIGTLDLQQDRITNLVQGSNDKASHTIQTIKDHLEFTMTLLKELKDSQLSLLIGIKDGQGQLDTNIKNIKAAINEQISQVESGVLRKLDSHQSQVISTIELFKNDVVKDSIHPINELLAEIKESQEFYANQITDTSQKVMQDIDKQISAFSQVLKSNLANAVESIQAEQKCIYNAITAPLFPEDEE